MSAPTTEQFRQDNWDAAMTHLARAWEAMRTAYDILPPAPADGVCPHCGNSDWTNPTLGMGQFCEVRYEPGNDRYDTPGGWHGITDGWDDMTEDGEVSYLRCDHCDKPFQMPKDLTWN